MSRMICGITGHRDIPAEKTNGVKKALEQEIDRALADGYTCFLSGFAAGADLLFAEIVANKIRKSPAIELKAAIPCQGRLDTLKRSRQTGALVDCCTQIYVVSERYYPGVYAKRNRFLVEQSNRIIAVYDGRKAGGTADTLRLAQRMGKDVREISIGAMEVPASISK